MIVIVKGQKWDVESVGDSSVTLTTGAVIECSPSTLEEVKSQFKTDPKKPRWAKKQQ